MAANVVDQKADSSSSTRTSTPATFDSTSASSSSEKVSSEFDKEESEKEDTVKIQVRPPSERTLSPPKPAPKRLPVRKRVEFAEPLSASSEVEFFSDSDGEMNPTEVNIPSGSDRNINVDFDLSNRTNVYRATRFSGISRKLNKKRSSLLPDRRSSSSSISQQFQVPKRNSSASSASNRSIGARLSAIFGSNDSRPSTPTRAVQPANSATTIPNTRLEDLPSDRSALEGLINIHLSKLDRYKRQVGDFNTVIESLIEECRKLVNTSEARAVPQLVMELDMEIAETRAARDSKRVYVQFHRGELKLIAEKRVALDESQGIPPSLPQVYDGLDSEAVWEQRFW